MTRHPATPGTNIVAFWMKLLILIVSIAGGITALALFSYYLGSTGSEKVSRSIAFATLGINSLVYVFSIRTLTQPFWKQNPFENKWLNLAVLAGLFFQILPFTTAGLRNFFGLESLTATQWIVVFSASVTMFIIIEISKHFVKGTLITNRKSLVTKI